MIERTVLVKLKEKFTAANERREIARHSETVLAEVPGVSGVTVAVAADDGTSACWDMMLTVRFASLADVPAYAADPAHRSYVDAYLRPRMELLKAWNFETLSTEPSR